MRIEEVAASTGRTNEELAALIAAGGFIPKTAELTTGEPLWGANVIERWLAENPPPSAVMTFSEHEVHLSRTLAPGVYTLTRKS